MNRLIAALTLAALCGAGASVWAQQATNIRGTITAFDGQTIAVATRDGKAVEAALPEGVNVSGTKTITLTELKPGETIFISARREADGKLTAARVQVSTNGVKPTQ